MSRHPALRSDFAIAVLAALVLVIVSPGLAIVGIVAIVVLIVCGVSLLVERHPIRRWRRRR